MSFARAASSFEMSEKSGRNPFARVTGTGTGVPPARRVPVSYTG